MQEELNLREDLDLDIQIIGINEPGFESANDLMTDGRDLPWLQDTDEEEVWDSWDHVYRDVILLGEDNVEVGRYNLSAQDLSDPDNFTELLELFVDAASF